MNPKRQETSGLPGVHSRFMAEPRDPVVVLRMLMKKNMMMIIMGMDSLSS